MNLERTKPETLAAGVMDYMPQSLAAHEYAERLNAALARLGLTDRLTLPPAPNTAIDELPAVVDVPLRKTLSVLMGKAQQGDASALATLEMAAQVMESIFAGLHARASVYPLALPSHESLATLSQGVDALLPRKISTGWSVASLLADPTCDGIDDGVSLVRLLCSDAADSVTELNDDNEGWVANVTSTTVWSALAQFKALKKLVVGCAKLIAKTYPNATISNLPIEEITFPNLEVVEEGDRGIIYQCQSLISALFPKLHTLYSGWNTNHNYDGLLVECNAIKTITLPSLKRFENRQLSGSYNCIMYNDAALEELIMPSLQELYHNTDYIKTFCVAKCPSIKKVVVGALNVFRNVYIVDEQCTELIHVEFGQGTSTDIYLNHWNPTSVLSDSERLPIFLSNFKTYIAERLSEQGSGLTLTLSQAVRDAIQQDPEIVSIITSKGWTISPAPSV